MSTRHEMNLQPLVFYPLLEGFYILALTVRPSSPYRRLIFIPIVSLSLYFLFCSKLSLENFQQTYAAGCRFTSLIFFASTDILLSNPQQDFHHIPPRKRPISDEGLGARFGWALEILFNPRGINYAHEAVTHTTPRPTETTKMAFIRRQLKIHLLWGIFWELCLWSNRYNPYVQQRNTPSDIVGIQNLWRLGIIPYWMSIPFSMEGYYRIASIIAVLGGWSQPRNWPNLFGSFLEAYTVHERTDDLSSFCEIDVATYGIKPFEECSRHTPTLLPRGWD
ncbi:hypothetical protein CVT24_007336 [Panaeolus cyanescens]|uniref:Wax synthase domain-containing protein n=1 Tax=Panaeolus cyanescens TaxID=181874 RepID=A0A409W5C9_9AGAR|nr:hypothetical protein CVT24_007336 [Panaeolus cyanescens]